MRDVRHAFEECPIVKINCTGMHASDYKKIGAKLKVSTSGYYFYNVAPLDVIMHALTAEVRCIKFDLKHCFSAALRCYAFLIWIRSSGLNWTGVDSIPVEEIVQMTKFQMCLFIACSVSVMLKL